MSRNTEKRSRSKAACDRCRSRRSKCSGTIPCQACAKTRHPCRYSETKRKAIVLESKLKSLEYKALQYDILTSSNSIGEQYISEARHQDVPNITRTRAISLILTACFHTGFPLRLDLMKAKVAEYCMREDEEEEEEDPCIVFPETLPQEERWVPALLMMVLALGEIYDNSNPRPIDSKAGLPFFIAAWRAFEHLRLETPHPIEAIEFMNGASFYFRAIGDDINALTYSGLALQMCSSTGMFRRDDFSEESELDEESVEVQYGRVVFWTTYIINRFLSVKDAQAMLLDRQIITRQYPLSLVYGEPSLKMGRQHLKSFLLIGRLAEEVNHIVYQKQGSLQNRQVFLKDVLEMLQRLIDWKKSIPDDASLTHMLSMSNMKRRLVLTVHLFYCLLIQLATAPVLVKILERNYHRSILSGPLQSVISNCFSSAGLSLNIITHLHKTDMFAIHGPSDTDYLYHTALTFAIFLAMGSDDPDMTESYIQFSLDLLLTMSERGNRKARHRYQNLEKLFSGIKSKRKRLSKQQKVCKIQLPDIVQDTSFMTPPQSFNFFSKEDLQFWEDAYLNSPTGVNGDNMMCSALEKFVK